MNNSVTSINGKLTKKADATALNALTNRVSTAEGTITSQGNSITSLRNDLNATNDKVSSKADSSALNSLDSKVTSIDGRVTSNTSAVTSLQGRVSTVEGGLSSKADASALSNYYTKTEADAATSGAINSFNSQLTIGGVNVVANSEAPRTSTAATNKEYLLYERSAELKAFYDENLEKPITISFEMSVPVAGPVRVYSSNGSAHQFVTSVNAIIVNQFAKYSVTVSPKAHTASTTVSTIEFYGTYGTGRIPTIRKLQIEAGTKATAWSPSPRDTKAAIDANASAISKIDTRVTNAEGTITSQGNSITQLNNSVTSINGKLTKKADATALNALTNRVSTAEGTITSQGNSITSLTNSLAVSGKGGTNLLIKSNVVGLYDGVSYPHHTYKLGEDWEIGAKYTLIWCAEHKRGTGDNNSYLAVYAGGGSQTLQSIVNTDGKVISKVTFVKNSAVASGPIIHFYMINRPTADKGTIGTVYWAVLVKGDVLTTDAWIPSTYDYIPDSNANASAITNLTNTVTQQGNTLTSHTNSITSLNNSITTINGTLSSKADSSALNSLANRVSTAEGAISSQGSSITSLNSSVTGILKDIEVTDSRSTNQPPSWYWSNYPKRIVREFKRASTIGLSGMGTYVSLETYVYYSDATGGPIIQIARGTNSKLTAERRSTSTSTWGTWVQDIKAISDGLANKAEASALSSLDSKVSVIDGKVSTQASSITTLQTTVGGNTASIQSQQQSIDGLKARATLKLQSGNLVGGVGIENDSKTVDFIIQANRFAIGAPSDVTGTVTPKYAFAYQSTPTTLPNGTVIPAGLYLDNASIGYINASRIWADNLSAISADLGTIKVKNANIEDGAIDTLKIKDEAVTVPIGVKAIDVKTITTFAGGVTSGQPNNDFNNHLAAWENHIGTLLQVTLNRSGGKVRLDASVNICTPTFGAFSVSDGRGNPIAANDRAMASFYISIYKNGSLIGRGSLGANIETGNINVNFNGTAVIVSAIDDNSTIGNVTYTLKAGFARQEGVNIPLNVESRSNFMITSRTLSVIEMKK